MFGPEGFGGIRGDAGFITVAAGAKAGIINRWAIRRSGTKPDGTPRLRFWAQFSWFSEGLMNMASKGQFRPRVIVQMKTKVGQENIDVLAWDEWKFEGGVLTLENILHVEGVVQK